MSDINEKKIYTASNISSLLYDKPILTDGQIYIYVLLNSANAVKIGKTTNMAQRHKSLSGSNGGSNKIIKCYVSPATYIDSIERTCHNHYDRYRVPGTEWFKGKDIVFEEVVEYVDSLFRSKTYETCNTLRKQLYKKDEKDKKDNE